MYRCSVTYFTHYAIANSSTWCGDAEVTMAAPWQFLGEFGMRGFSWLNVFYLSFGLQMFRKVLAPKQCETNTICEGLCVGNEYRPIIRFEKYISHRMSNSESSDSKKPFPCHGEPIPTRKNSLFVSSFSF